MRLLFLGTLFIVAINGQLAAQNACLSTEYRDKQLQNTPTLAFKLEEVESFIQKKLAEKSTSTLSTARGNGPAKLTIPVVVHIIYHKDDENINDERVYNQIAVLNDCFRRLNSDTVNTPARFRALAADCEIEFELAKSDPRKRATTGIVRKYSPVTQWDADDNIKYSAQTGDDAWDSRYYLNIWVCNLRHASGYSSFPGGPAEKDGIVLSYNVFGTNGNAGYEGGKTAVHETGHWLGLRHIWGDSYCGDDWVNDTPKQGNFTTGCPSGIRISCSNGPDGDMYMNYMDISSDACTNLFTKGQKERMLALFTQGGARNTLLTSTGLNPPVYSEIPAPDDEPRWFHPQLYPNPAISEIMLDVAYDIRWIGKTVNISNAQGIVVMQVTINNKLQKIELNKLSPGIYFISAKKEDGATIKQKFIKM